MIKHIVCFKLKDNSAEECKKAADILKSMESNVDLLRGIEVGVDFLHSPRSYDIILQVVLDDADALTGNFDGLCNLHRVSLLRR